MGESATVTTGTFNPVVGVVGCGVVVRIEDAGVRDRCRTFWFRNADAGVPAAGGVWAYVKAPTGTVLRVSGCCVVKLLGRR